MDEVELLQSEEAEAKASLRDTLSELRRDLGAAVSARGWVKERPLASLLVAGSLSMAIGFGLGRMGKRMLQSSDGKKAPSPPRPERIYVAQVAEEPKPGAGSRVARWAMIGAREAFMLALAVLGRTLKSSPEALEEAARAAAEERGEVVSCAGAGQ
jgi:hypothetical protein